MGIKTAQHIQGLLSTSQDHALGLLVSYFGDADALEFNTLVILNWPTLTFMKGDTDLQLILQLLPFLFLCCPHGTFMSAKVLLSW